MENKQATDDHHNLESKINEIQMWISNQKTIPGLTDKTLELFLHSCFYDVEKTKTTILSYYKLRIQSPEYFLDRNPSAMEIIAATTFGYCILLPGMTPDGYRVIMSGYLHSDTTNFNYKALMKRYMMIVDMWLSKLDICNGYFFVIDCKNCTFSHATCASLDSLKKMCVYFQEALPVRLQGIVFTNISPAMNLLLSIVYPFLTKRLTKMLHRFPRGNYDYFEIIPQRMLPKELGGDLQSVQELQVEAQRELEDNYEWFQKEDATIKRLANEQQTTTENKNLIESLF